MMLVNPFFVASSGPSLPSDLSNLVRWYKADSFSLADNTPVGGGGNEWIDQSASVANLTQANAGNRPVYHTNVYGSMPAITFTAASSHYLDMPLLTLAGSPAGRFTIVIVASSDNDNIVLGHSSENMQVRYRHGSAANLVFFYAGSGSESGLFTNAQNTLRATTWKRVDAVGDIEFRDNKIAVSASSNDPGEFHSDEVGAATGLGGFYINGNIAEICVWTDSHSNTDMDALYDNYFQPRWGLP